ncbi:TPA: hypothetical protein ACOXWE_004593 [Salmonella enterica]
MVINWLAAACLIFTAILFLIQLTAGIPRTGKQLSRLLLRSAYFPVSIMVGAMIIGTLVEPILWKTSNYPAWLAHSVTLKRPAIVGGNVVMDAETVENLCDKPAPAPDVSQMRSGLYIRCGSPFIDNPGVYRITWKN